MSGVIIAGNTSGSVTLDAPAVSGSTVITLPTVSGTMMVNGPAFFAYPSTPQAYTGGTFTKVSLQLELFDTASAFDSTTNYRFQPLVAGYYQVNGAVMMATTSTTNWVFGSIYKNGSAYSRFSSVFASSSNYPSSTGSALVYLNGSTDYIELYVYCNASVNINDTAPYTNFSAVLTRNA